MIRRGFWLTTGAVLGVMGYRRLTRLANELTGGSVTAGAPDGRTRPPAGRAALHDPAQRSAVPHDPARRSSASTLARVVAAVGFARDVRTGMAEYLDLHHRELARTLKSRGGRVTPG